MRKIVAAVLLTSVGYMASCQNASSTKSPTQAGTSGQVVNTLSASDFEQKLSSQPVAQLIDVRTPEEYSEGHLKNATNIDVNSDGFESGISKLDKAKPVFVYCRSGGRSSRAAGKMEEMGFKVVYNLNGGITDWQSAGKTVEASK